MMMFYMTLSGPIIHQKSRVYRKSMINSHNPAQSGNAFWIILLCIALLTALTITVTRSGESTEETGARDRNRIMASDILRQAKSIQQGVEQLRLAGVAENQMNFDNTAAAGYANDNCGDTTLNTDDDPCSLFDVKGAGLTYKVPLSGWLDEALAAAPLTQPDLYGEWYIHATACIPRVGTGDATCNLAESSTELMIGLPWIRRELCLEINRLAGVPNPPRAPATIPEPPLLVGTAYTPTMTKFTGTFEAGSVLDDASGTLTKHQTGCFEASEDANAGRPDYHFYHVLIAR
jgi:hypothetical protein